MKFVLVLACLLAFACADDDVKVLRNDVEVHHDSFKYALELDNHIKAIQEGVLKDEHTWTVKGEYEFVTPKGVHVKVTYTADDHGYHAITHL